MLALTGSIGHTIKPDETSQQLYNAQPTETHHSENSHIVQNIRATVHAQKYAARNQSLWLIAGPIAIVCMYSFFGCSALPDIRLAFATTIMWLIANIRAAYEIDAITTNAAHHIDDQLAHIDKQIEKREKHKK
jgi:hypothetical protein